MNENKLHKLYKNPTIKLLDVIKELNDKSFRGKFSSYEIIKNNSKKDVNFREIISFLLSKRSTMVNDEKLMKSLVNIANNYNKKIRELNTLKFKSHNIDKQFNELVYHLFCKYKVPNFLYRCWFGKIKYIDWFIELGQGKNIRKCENLPIPLTKKMAYYFTQAPDELEPLEAIRHAQILNLGGTFRNTKGILATKLGINFKNDEFWLTVFKFFIDNPMLDTAQYGNIIDYINEIKYQNRLVNIGGLNKVAGPEKPNFSMKQRNVDTLLNDVEKWHKALNKTGKDNDGYWKGLPIEDFSITVGKDEHKKYYEIKQLLTKKQLYNEGKALCHCVSSYSNSCARGYTSIFSFSTFEYGIVEKKILTIEVSNNKQVIQIRGKNNREPNANEMFIVNKWISENNLKMSRWLQY